MGNFSQLKWNSCQLGQVVIWDCWLVLHLGLLLHWHGLSQWLSRNTSHFGGLPWGEWGRKGKMLTALACCAGSMWSCWWKIDLTPSTPCFRHISDVGASKEWSSRLRGETLGILKTRMMVLKGALFSLLYFAMWSKVLSCLSLPQAPANFLMSLASNGQLWIRKLVELSFKFMLSVRSC